MLDNQTEQLIQNLTTQTTETASNIIKQTLSSVLSVLKPFVNVALVIALIIIAYWLLRVILVFLQNRRIKKIYKNTKLILKKLEILEEKIDKLTRHKEEKKRK